MLKRHIATLCIITLCTISSVATADPAGEQIKFCDQTWAADVEELRCEDALLTDVAPLARFTKLKKLYLEAEVENPDFSPLTKLHALTELTLYQTGITDLSPLGKVTSLQRLIIVEANPLRDLGPLAKLTNLQWLTINSNEMVVITIDLGPLKALVNLRGFSLSVTTTVPINIAPLGTMVNLEALSLEGFFQDLAPVTKFKKLVSLTLMTEQVVDIQAYAQFTALTILNVRSSKITLAELESFKKLRPEVDVPGCKAILTPPCGLPEKPVQSDEDGEAGR